MVKIEGQNLGEVSAELKKLSDYNSIYNWVDDSKKKNEISKLENLYLNLCNHVNEFKIKPMEIDQNEQVIIQKNMINHRCSNNLEVLQTISQYGILASEWFGKLESEQEGCFCTFISRMKDDDYNCNFRGDLAEDNFSRLNKGDDVLLFFDEDNPIMKYLLHLDYFEFEYQKSCNPNYKQLYTDSELSLLENLIEPLSPAGNDMRQNFDWKTNYWSAIPGGIPSSLVTGVCIKNNTFTDSEIDLINSYFPKAVIFDSKQNVVRYPSQLVDKTERQM